MISLQSLQPCKSIQYCSIPYPSIRSIPFSYYTCHAPPTAQKRYSLFFFWKCLPHWNCKEELSILIGYSKDILPKKNKKGSKSRWLQLAHQGQALRVLKKKSPPYRVVFFSQKPCLSNLHHLMRWLSFFFVFFFVKKFLSEGISEANKIISKWQNSHLKRTVQKLK